MCLAERCTGEERCMFRMHGSESIRVQLSDQVKSPAICFTDCISIKKLTGAPVAEVPSWI